MAAFCSGCGNSLGAGERFCRVCGRDSTLAPGTAATPVAPSPIPSTPVQGTPIPGAPGETSGKAITSLVCGLFLFFPPASIAAIVFGHISLSEIKKSAGRLQGQGMAIAGLVLGYVGIAGIPVILIIAAIAIPNLLRARMAANESSAVASIRQINVAEVTYSTNHGDKGFACTLSDLSDEKLISGDLATGRKTGYVIEIKNCSPAQEGLVNVKYQVVAYPAVRNQSGARAFCSDESAVIRVDPHGSAEACMESGEPLSQ
jgi:type IV pilus assembly protein PilA